MKERVAGTEAGKGDLGKAEMLNAERAVANATRTDKAANRLDEVKGSMLRGTPESDGIERILRCVPLMLT